MRRLFLFFLVGTAIALPAVPPAMLPASGSAAADHPRLTIAPAHPRQGEVLFVRLEAPTATHDAEGAEGPAPRAEWRGRSYPLARHDGAWVALLPIDAATPAGTHPLTLRFTPAGGQPGRPIELRRSISVAATRFPVQRLRMARRTERLYRYPGVEKEERLLSAALRTRSPRCLWRGEWRMPARGRTSTLFGVRRIRNGRDVGRHRGLDIAAPAGAPVVAPAAGRVVLAEPAQRFRKYGNTVVLDHGLGVTSLYIHMSALAARPGQLLEAGQMLGRVGSTGVATGPHLHWGVYVQGTAVSPRFFCALEERGVPPTLL